MYFDNKVLENILLNLNLNEGVKFRLVNKQFKEIIDSIDFQDDLIIFERKEPAEGKFKFTNKLWYLDQCVYVTDLNLFFEQFNQKLINLRSLVVYGLNNGIIYNCGINFKVLKHLELYDIQFKSTKILQSPELKNLYLTSNCYFQDNIELKVNKLENAIISANVFNKFNSTVSSSNLLNKQKSSLCKEYDYLELNTQFTIDFNLFTIIYNLNIQHLKIQTNLNTAFSIINNNKSIMIMDISLITHSSNYLSDLKRLVKYLKQTRNLEVRLFGIKIELLNYEKLNFILSILSLIFIKDGEIGFTISDCRCPLIKQSKFIDNVTDLKNFLEQLSWIEFKNHLHLNEFIFNKMVNIKTILLSFTIETDHDYDELFNCFPQLKHIKVTQNLETSLSNNLVDSLSSKCLNLQYFKFYCFQPLDFDFLFKMNNLKCLILLIYYPIYNDTFINLIKQLNYLSFISIQFPIKEYDSLKEELRDFKQEVISVIKSKIKSNKFNFLIQLLKQKLNDNTICTILKYKYERNDFSKTKFENLDNDLNNKDLKEICKVVEHKGIKLNQLKRSKNYYKNNLLIDDMLFYILKNFFDLNERTRLRLVSNKFKYIIDKIFIKKLVVYNLRQRSEFISDLTGEKFSLHDTVYVYDLNKFFNSKIILNSIKYIEKLIIFSYDKYVINIKTSFTKLNHLEIYKQTTKTADILKSPNISNLLLSNCYFYDRTKINMMSKEDMFFNCVGLNNLNKIKKLSILLDIPKLGTEQTEVDFFRRCKIKNLFSELEQLNCNLIEFETIKFINDNFKNLKIFNIYFGKNNVELIKAIGNNDLDNIVDKLRDDLIVNFFGCQLTKQTVSIIKRFLIHFKDGFRFHDNIGKIKIILIIYSEWNNFKLIFGRYENLFDGFFKLVASLIFKDKLGDTTIFNKLDTKLIDSTLYILSPNFRFFDLSNYIKLFPKIFSLSLTGHIKNYDINHILIKLPEYLKNLAVLTVDYNKINFKFLINLPPTIKIIDLNSKYSIEKELFLNLIRKYSKQNLAFIQNYFQLEKNFNRKQLFNFKTDALNLINNELKLINTSFKIEIIRRFNFTIGRYVFRRNNLLLDGEHKLAVNEEDIVVFISNQSLNRN